MILQIKILLVALAFTAGVDGVWEAFTNVQSYVAAAKARHEPPVGKAPSGLRPF